jgi:nitrate reductase beta subunit
MRAYMRAKSYEGAPDESIPAKVGMTGGEIGEMYRLMAIANYEDRFVIPTSHREYAEDAYDLRGECGFSFGEGCGEPKRAIQWTGLFARTGQKETA